jgi:hypothetical protein
MTIMIGSGVKTFLCQWIHGRKSYSIHVPCPIIHPVEPVHAVELLVVVLEALGIAVSAFTEEPAEGIVMVHLFFNALSVGHYTVVAKMILQIEMVLWRRAA